MPARFLSVFGRLWAPAARFAMNLAGPIAVAAMAEFG